MVTHTIRNVVIKTDGKEVARLPEARVEIEPNRIEVLVDEVTLSNETIGLLKLGTKRSLVEFEILGESDNRILTIKNAKVNRLTFDAKRGEPIFLKDIAIRGLSANWRSAK